jgi:ribosomal protein S21
MIVVPVKEGENIEKALKKFKRNVAAIRFFPVGMPTLRE